MYNNNKKQDIWWQSQAPPVVTAPVKNNKLTPRSALAGAAPSSVRMDIHARAGMQKRTYARKHERTKARTQKMRTRRFVLKFRTLWTLGNGGGRNGDCHDDDDVDDDDDDAGGGGGGGSGGGGGGGGGSDSSSGSSEIPPTMGHTIKRDCTLMSTYALKITQEQASRYIGEATQPL